MKFYTFLDFLELSFLGGEWSCVEMCKKIEIPRFQRDYAQGRQSKKSKEVAKAFLDAIFAVLENKERNLHLDLIYGYQDKQAFKLVDGQQRITTLWLLHFLLYKHAGQLDEIKDRLSKFTYNMRKSSKEFCENLFKKEENFEIEKEPSATIFSQGATFGTDLNDDPTTKAMIHMLDLIHNRLNGKNNNVLNSYIERLKCISFNIFNVVDMGFESGEDLYIKLNARGKTLSKYEKLKAFIEQKAVEIAQEPTKIVSSLPATTLGSIKKPVGSIEQRTDTDGAFLSNMSVNPNKTSKTDLYQNLLTVIDNEWSDYFFDSEQPDTFDDRMFHFLHYANAFFAFLQQEEEQHKEEQHKSAKEILLTDRVIDESYSFLQKEENLRLLDRVIKFLPRWQKEGQKGGSLAIKGVEFFDKGRENGKKKGKKETEGIELKKICYFFALLFLTKRATVGNNLADYRVIVEDKIVEDYLRVCRHFIENHSLDRVEYTKGFFRLFSEISQGITSGYNNFYGFLSSPEYELTTKFHEETREQGNGRERKERG
ncbi:hypothetical protein NHP21005_09590 [Helicobacter sp. NHP21005]|uniref:DUF262 domain-containing protein n=1 Tax=Helicobacter felistomachi TaxID=3040201 RepID=UPI00257414E5|nr:DUF262 domain-containing protein [Helicobacter sp. NHP21005]BEG57271.1 hypothetical protein NHP21005_09590 [Helicobacter sp. NHP21005]